MKRLYFILLLSAVTLRAGFAAPFDITSIDMPPIYKADDYIRAAVSLQAVGREAACEALLASARTNATTDRRFFMLCRMLFAQRGTNEFRPPFRGTCGFYIGEAADWKLDPIELVDGIPFLLTGPCRGQGGRGPESVESYLRYCMTNCDWSTYTFHDVTAQQKSRALATLLSSSKVKRPLTDSEKSFFSAQIQ
jgi:hypothetical protein